VRDITSTGQSGFNREVPISFLNDGDVRRPEPVEKLPSGISVPPEPMENAAMLLPPGFATWR